MMLSPNQLPALAGWDNFYVITGSSSAGLIGLMFVVISLTTGDKRRSADTLSAFATPSVVHFGAVLLISALLSMPGQTALSLTICIGACAAVGLLYSARVSGRMVRQHEYEPVWEDWLWYMLLPIASYLALMGAAVAIRRNPTLGLYFVAAIALMLLFIGMHNAWDTALWVSAHAPGDKPPASQSDPER
jgi:hypothetical protein